MRYRVGVLALLTLAVLSPRRATAQQEQQGWSFLIAPYLLFPHMNGTVGVGPISVDVDADPGDIFSNLQFGAMLAAEATNGQWSIGFDGLYMDLSKDSEHLSVQADGYQAGLELTGFRTLVPGVVEVLAGGRVNLLGTTLKSQSATLVDKNFAWFDPFLGMRFTIPHTGKWDIKFRGDVGGFGVGSEFAWQARALLGYNVSKHWLVGVSYWALGMDYETGERGQGDYFKYDVTTFGPEIGFAYKF